MDSRSRPSALNRAPVALLVFVCLGNVEARAQEVEVEAIRELGPLPFLEVIRGRDGGFSARFRDRSVWVFGDTPTNWPGEDGSSWRSSTWSWTEDFDARDGIAPFHEPVDALGVPGEFLPLTDEEAAFNEQRRGESRWALWPGPVVWDSVSGRALVFYLKVFSRPTGPWDFYGVGTSLAVWPSPDARPVRPEVRPDAGDPTLLFPAGEPALGAGAVVVGDQLYAYACDCKNLRCPCILASVTLAGQLDSDLRRLPRITPSSALAPDPRSGPRSARLLWIDG